MSFEKEVREVLDKYKGQVDQNLWEFFERLSNAVISNPTLMSEVKEATKNEEDVYIPMVNFVRLCRYAYSFHSDWFNACLYYKENNKIQKGMGILYNFVNSIITFANRNAIKEMSCANVEDVLYDSSQHILYGVLYGQINLKHRYYFSFDDITFNEFAIETKKIDDITKCCYVYNRKREYVDNSRGLEFSNRGFRTYITVRCRTCDNTEDDGNIVVSILKKDKYNNLFSEKTSISIPPQFDFSLAYSFTKDKVEDLLKTYGSYITNDYLSTLEALFGYYLEDTNNAEYVRELIKEFDLVGKTVHY